MVAARDTRISRDGSTPSAVSRRVTCGPLASERLVGAFGAALVGISDDANPEIVFFVSNPASSRICARPDLRSGIHPNCW